MAAVFTIATSTIVLRTGNVPRWLGVVGYIIGAVILVMADVLAWIELLFAAWLLVLSLHILMAGLRGDRAQAAATPPP